MTDIDLEQTLPTIRNLAKRKANMFARRYKPVLGESEDVESQLMLLFLRRWRCFDAARASIKTFASGLMDKELMSMLRHGLAQKRQATTLPALSVAPKPGAIQHFRIDVQKVLVDLPDAIKETAIALAWYSAVDAAAVLGCSRQIINKRKHLIRKALVSAGIGPDYFSNQRHRQ